MSERCGFWSRLFRRSPGLGERRLALSLLLFFIEAKESNTWTEMFEARPEVANAECLGVLVEGCDHHLTSGDVAKAERYAEAAEMLWEHLGRPCSAAALHLVDRWRRLERMERAERLARVLSEQITPPTTAIILGWLLMEKREYSQARQCFETAGSAVRRRDRRGQALIET